MRLSVAVLMASLSLLAVQPALADSLQSRCSIAETREATPEPRPCMFSQRQGNVDIRWLDEDKPFLELTGIEGVGMYVDAEGEPAYRRKGLGSDGTIYETSLGFVRVYWGS
jgi:hypothetical protein